MATTILCEGGGYQEAARNSKPGMAGKQRERLGKAGENMKLGKVNGKRDGKKGEGKSKKG